jgi:hypothetical protein
VLRRSGDPAAAEPSPGEGDSWDAPRLGAPLPHDPPHDPPPAGAPPPLPAVPPPTDAAVHPADPDAFGPRAAAGAASVARAAAGSGLAGPGWWGDAPVPPAGTDGAASLPAAPTPNTARAEGRREPPPRHPAAADPGPPSPPWGWNGGGGAAGGAARGWFEPFDPEQALPVPAGAPFRDPFHGDWADPCVSPAENPVPASHGSLREEQRRDTWAPLRDPVRGDWAFW